MKRLAEQVTSEDPAAAVPAPRPALSRAPVPAAAAVSAGQDAPLEGVVLDPVARRKAARDAAYRDHHGPVLFGYTDGSLGARAAAYPSGSGRGKAGITRA
jgi:hypothetical protein